MTAGSRPRSRDARTAPPRARRDPRPTRTSRLRRSTAPPSARRSPAHACRSGACTRRLQPPEICAVTLRPVAEHCQRIPRFRRIDKPGPSSWSDNAPRPHAAIINAGAGPCSSAPFPQVRPTSSARNLIPRSRPNGTKAIARNPVRKSSARDTRSGSGSKVRPSGIRMSPPWTRTSVRPETGPETGGLNLWSAPSRRAGGDVSGGQLRAASRQRVDAPVHTEVADGRGLKPPETICEHADEVSGDGLDVPAGTQALGRQLCLVETVDQRRDFPSLVGDSSEDELLIYSHVAIVSRMRAAATCSAGRASSAGRRARRSHTGSR